MNSLERMRKKEMPVKNILIRNSSMKANEVPEKNSPDLLKRILQVIQVTACEEICELLLGIQVSS